MTNVEEHLLANLESFHAFAKSRVSDPDLAADAVQDSLLKAIKSEHTLREQDNAVAWFYRILRRTIIDLYRRRGTDERAMARLEAELKEPMDADTESALCGCLRNVLPSLKPEYSELIDKVDLQGRQTASVASELGITPNNLTVRLHRARAQLKERLMETCRVCAKHGCLDCTCETAIGSRRSNDL